MRWGPKGEQIPMVTDIRDLGAHPSCAKRPSATHIKQRAEEALPIAKRVATMRQDKKRRVRELRAKVFAKALYVVEAAQMPEAVARRRRLQCRPLPLESASPGFGIVRS